MALADDQDGEIPQQLGRCPQCGAEGGKPAGAPSLFVWISIAALVLALFVPRLLLVIPVLAAVACAIAALVRRERYGAGAWLVLGLAAALMVWEASKS
jgi:hypothetical protein